MSRLFLVECNTGRIWSEGGEPSGLPEPLRFVESVRELDLRLGRYGRTYIGHPRNPAPGDTIGYYVYRDNGSAGACAPTTVDTAGDTPPADTNWQAVGFVEVIPSAIVDRVWIEPHAGAWVVCCTGDEHYLTDAAVTRAEAERIARDYSLRTGAFLVPGSAEPERRNA